jgi:hypothetical protein
MGTQSLAILILVIVFGGYFLLKAYHFVDNFVTSQLGEDVPFLVDINFFILYWVTVCGISYWLYKVIFIALGADYVLVSDIDLYLLSIFVITSIGSFLSMTYSSFFGFISLILIFWPAFKFF